MISRQTRGFTLIEMLMVMVIIAVLAGLIMGVSNLAMSKSARTRATGEIKALETACENYKSDNGSVPRAEGITEGTGTGAPPIDPRMHGDPGSASYTLASTFLYQQLAGDDGPDGIPGDNGLKVYMEFKPNMLKLDKPAGSTGQKVTALVDPFGNSYGYSTAAARMEDAYREKARLKVVDTTDGSTNQGVERETELHGYNPSFDLWSTAGTTKNPPNDDTRKKWIKNW
jgi:prepilin-type N-terminal cleavage/methylation domain-containing protein